MSDDVADLLMRAAEQAAKDSEKIKRLTGALGAMFVADHGLLPGGIMCRAIARKALDGK